jgi:hypothetical protein
MKPILAFLFLLSASFVLKAQDTGAMKSQTVSLQFKAGISHKVNIGNVFPSEYGPRELLVSNPDLVTSLLYTNEEKNMLGPGLDLGVEFKIQPWNTAFEYRMGIRYDHLYHSREINQITLESVNGLFYEHHFVINQYLGRGRLQPLITTGLSLLNRGASYQVIAANDELVNYDLQTSAFNAGFGLHIDQFTVTFRNFFISSENNPYNIINDNLPSSPKKGFSVQEISLHYTF